MLKIVGREATRAYYIINRLRVFYERMQIPKTEPAGINLAKGYQNFKLIQNDLEAYQDSSRVSVCKDVNCIIGLQLC